MKLFTCQACEQLLFFENTRCERCGHVLGYLPERRVLSALAPAGDGRWQPLAGESEARRFCANAAHDACNWLVEPGSPSPYCRACCHNRIIPDIGVVRNLLRWQKVEAAKHRLIYTLLALGLPLVSKAEDPTAGLAFDFLAPPGDPDADAPPIMTGHADGLITINVAEADDHERERRRSELAEPYRTLLGHLRHEVGHYYWDRLVRDADRLEPFRALFGDERADYGAALQRHYAQGAPPDWRERFVSTYASAHPWEDFAETWAHYLHIVDTLETAKAFRMRVHPEAGPEAGRLLAAEVDFEPDEAPTIGRIMAAWLPVSFAVNCLNRSMGQPDLYPFVLSPLVIEKLGYMHGLVQAARAR
jgi:hypothetical protein